MSNFLSYAFIRPGTTSITIPAGFNGLKERMTGTLNLSRSGYVYANPSKTVVWLKFLGLALSLPFQGIASKCAALVKGCFGYSLPKKGWHDLKHTFHLAGIAWKGVLGGCGKTLMERVEEFALSELDYNHDNRDLALTEQRSVRFSTGKYAATCMQPLFHKTQCSPPENVRQQIQNLEKNMQDLKNELLQREKKEQFGWKTSFVEVFFGEERAYKDWEKSKIESTYKEMETQLKNLKKMTVVSDRCHQYAYRAIYQQQCCPGVQEAFEENFVTTDADVKCCGERCFRQQRICGLLYKIDCCATRCWALDCFCCFCCLWPEGRTYCIL